MLSATSRSASRAECARDSCLSTSEDALLLKSMMQTPKWADQSKISTLLLLMETCCTTAPQGSACANTAHSAPPPPARKSLLSHISILCNVHAHGMAPRMRPASLNSSRQRSDQQDTKRAHTRGSTEQLGSLSIGSQSWLSQGKLHQSGKIPQTVYAPEGHTLPQQEKKGMFVLSQHSQRIFYGNVQTRGFCETLLWVINQLFLVFKAASSQRW